MAGSWKRISSLSKGLLGIVTRIILVMIIGPLLIALYVISWIRFKLTALIYCNNNRSMLSNRDVVPILDIHDAHGIINAIIFIGGNFSLDAMKELMLSKVLKANDANGRPLFPKLTRYIELCAGYLMWTEESNFNIDDHIRPHSGQPPEDEEQLKTLITDLCHKPFPPLKSCWGITVIPVEYSRGDVHKTCVLFRVHHFMTDGMSILRLILEQMAGNHGAYQPILERMQSKFKQKFKNPFLNFLENIGQIICNYCIFNQTQFSKHKVNQVFMKDEHKVCELSEYAFIDWSSAIKMDTIRLIKDATSTSVNDVLISCMAGAFRKYFVTHDISPPDLLKSFIPISFHGPDEPVQMINKVFAVVSWIPTGEMDCLQRLKATKSLMDQSKCLPEYTFNHWFVQYCGNILPYRILKQLDEYFHGNIAFSNMPGPTSKAAFNGHTIESLVLMHLPVSRLGFGVFVFTYSGYVTVSVTVDKARVSSREDVRQLLDDLVEEVQQLYNSVICLSTAMEKKMD